MRRVQYALVASWIVVALVTHVAGELWRSWPANDCRVNCTEIAKQSLIEEVMK